MRILALEPYHGGSHQAFLDGWIRHSRHDWTVVGLPAHAWKWRMHHAPVTLAGEVRMRQKDGQGWDALFCSDMLDLAAFRGLAPRPVRELPALVYFHENQLVYPILPEARTDDAYGFTNFTTCLAAKRIWFNSAYNRDSFFEALEKLVRRMPDHAPLGEVAEARARAEVRPVGISPVGVDARRARNGPLHILWAARWEHDKDPETFFSALRRLDAQGAPFRLSVIGPRFRRVPSVFERARVECAEHIVRWGHQETRAAYEAALRDADVIVSTARHEFFGISILEAADAGVFPLVPNALAYPELLDPKANPDFFHDGTVDGVTHQLGELVARHARSDLWQGRPERARDVARRFHWAALAPGYDDAVESMVAD